MMMISVVSAVAVHLFLLPLIKTMETSVTPQGNDCITYRSKLTSIPDLTHNIAYQRRQEVGYVIEDVKSTSFERSYYWCELDVSQKGGTYKKYRHFGFNSTHWWVEKGCGGWFIITECAPLSSDSTKSSAAKETAKESEYKITRNDSTLSEGESTDDPNDPYRKWPRIGYMSPHSDIMWDILDRATHVDVPGQLGFFSQRREPRSVAFNGLD